MDEDIYSKDRINLEIKRVIEKIRKNSYECLECGCFVSDTVLEEELLNLINWRDMSLKRRKQNERK